MTLGYTQNRQKVAWNFQNVRPKISGLTSARRLCMDTMDTICDSKNITSPARGVAAISQAKSTQLGSWAQFMMGQRGKNGVNGSTLALPRHNSPHGIEVMGVLKKPPGRRNLNSAGSNIPLFPLGKKGQYLKQAALYQTNWQLKIGIQRI